MRNHRLAGLATRRSIAALFCAPLLALTGCGGGGGDGATTPVGPPAQGSLVITAANAKPVAADALDNATNIDAARTSSSFVLSAQVVPGAAAPSLALRVAQAAVTLANKRAGAAPLVLSAAINETLACSLGGSVTVSGNVASSNGFVAGDSVTLNASGCRETIANVATTLSGGFTLAITAGGISSGAAFPRHVAMTIQASGLTVAAGGETSTSSGDMSLDVTENSTDSTSVVLTGSSLGNQVTSASGTRSFTMRSYRHVLAIAGNTTSATVTADFETSNSRLGTAPVTYHVSTPSALVTTNAGDVSAGSLRVDGSASALLVTVTGTNTFQLQVDTNGDGSFDASSTATLADLRAQL
ncbi:hypothetical protein [Ramlibacter sp. AN1133]|uniref:hypothetical protein n=1 Tax=Ramlibacter sp. AN1133 TaxID=3133429 RepID=UPI0030BEF295